MAHIEILGLEERRVANDGHADDVLESKVEHEASLRKGLNPRTTVR